MEAKDPLRASVGIDSDGNVWPPRAEAYQLLSKIGTGASASVYKACCLDNNKLCAIKQLDLDSISTSLEEVTKEIQVMGTCKHPNVLSYNTAFVSDRHLWLVMPLLTGSILDILQLAFPKGLDENAIAVILKDTLTALSYLHGHGQIHRDVKAGNILIDSDGRCLLGDFGVAGHMREGGMRVNARSTFVGTPCWMAPEVVDTMSGYNQKADIWSLGITAIELAHGHAPFHKHPPMKVLLMTLQNPPPALNQPGEERKFSKNFDELVELCLQKDPAKRPSAAKLLEHKFFKNVRKLQSEHYLQECIISKFISLGGIEAVLKHRENNREATEDTIHEAAQEVDAWDFSESSEKTESSEVDTEDEAPELQIGRFKVVKKSTEAPEKKQNEGAAIEQLAQQTQDLVQTLEILKQRNDGSLNDKIADLTKLLNDAVSQINALEGNE